MEFWKLFITALMPVLKVLLITAVGAFLALDRFDILKARARRHLNTEHTRISRQNGSKDAGSILQHIKQVVYFVFTPALVGSILTKTITMRSLLMLWFMPLNILLTFIIGAALGWLLLKLISYMTRRLTTLCILMQIVGLIIGVVPPFRKPFVGDNAPLRVVEDSAIMLGDASIPAITLLVGANLIEGFKRSAMKLPLVVGIIVVRYIALPVFGVGIIKGAVHFGLIHHDPLYQFILLLQYALPPAINISTITQLFGAGTSVGTIFIFMSCLQLMPVPQFHLLYGPLSSYGLFYEYVFICFTSSDVSLSKKCIKLGLWKQN